jgi:lysophospholipase L1-like esterase
MCDLATVNRWWGREKEIPMKRLTLVLTAAALSVAFAVPAGAGDGLAPGLPVYLAMGNSLAAGSGASDQSTTAYVPLFHDVLQDELDCSPAASEEAAPGCRDLQLHNIAVGGAKSSDLIAVQLPIAVAELSARNGDANPRNDVEVVTVDIGGNDLFEPVIGACAGGFSPDCGAGVQSVFGTFAVNFHSILGQLRAAAGPDTPIIVMTYYNSLLACDLAALAPLADVVLEGAGEPPLPFGFNGVIRQIAAGYDADVADTYGDLGAGDLVGGTDCLHPDDSGHAIIAAEFQAAFDS